MELSPRDADLQGDRHDEARTPSGDNDHEMKLSRIKGMIDTREYQVDEVAVADALIRRLREGRERRQSLCSNPASSPGKSANSTPGGPSSTLPIQVTPTEPRTIALIAFRVFGGAQTQSS